MSESFGETVEKEFEGQHGTVLTGGTMEGEVDPENHTQTAGEWKDKISAETEAEGGGPIAAAKAVLHHLDRDIAGEYERREDPTADPNPQTSMPGQAPPGQAGEGGSGERG